MTEDERLDAAAHRFLHGDIDKCVSPERAEELRAAGGHPIVCLWGMDFGEGSKGAKLRAALAAEGLVPSPL